MTVPILTIPLLLSLCVVLAACFWRLPERRGDYDFGRPLAAAAHLAVGVIALLLVWLVYFALT